MPWVRKSGRQSNFSPDWNGSSIGSSDWHYQEPPKPPTNTSLFPSIPSTSPFTSSSPTFLSTLPKSSPSRSYPSPLGGYSGHSSGGGPISPIGVSPRTSATTTPQHPSCGINRTKPYRVMGGSTSKLCMLGVLAVLALSVLMYWRCYVSFDGSGIVINGTPAVRTANGLMYRKFDMDMEFRNRNIWTKPETVEPNSYIEAGPIWTANRVCPQGNFTVKGDLRNSRSSVPNGTLT
jgi:hypothetical protein